MDLASAIEVVTLLLAAVSVSSFSAVYMEKKDNYSIKSRKWN